MFSLQTITLASADGPLFLFSLALLTQINILEITLSNILCNAERLGEHKVQS